MGYYWKIFSCNRDDQPVFSRDMSHIIVETGKTYVVPDRTQPIRVDKYGLHFTPDLAIACLFGMPVTWTEPFYVAKVSGYPLHSHEGSYLNYASSEITVQKMLRIDFESEFAKSLDMSYKQWFQSATTGGRRAVVILEDFLNEKGF